MDIGEFANTAYLKATLDTTSASQGLLLLPLKLNIEAHFSVPAEIFLSSE